LLGIEWLHNLLLLGVSNGFVVKLLEVAQRLCGVRGDDVGLDLRRG